VVDRDGSLQAGGCSPLSFAYFSLRRQRKVGAAPHRGNANKPKAKQGKANTITKPPKRRAGKKNQLQNLNQKSQNHSQNKSRHKRKRILLPENPESDIPGHPPNPKLPEPGPGSRQNGHGDKRSQQPPNHRAPLTELQTHL
jgi:hypothetical protein